MKNESKFVMLALSAWFYAQCLQHELSLSQQFSDLAADYYTACEDENSNVVQLAALDTQLQQLFTQFESEFDVTSINNWENDRALVTMYSKGLQARAAKKK